MLHLVSYLSCPWKFIYAAINHVNNKDTIKQKIYNTRHVFILTHISPFCLWAWTQMDSCGGYGSQPTHQNHRFLHFVKNQGAADNSRTCHKSITQQPKDHADSRMRRDPEGVVVICVVRDSHLAG